MVTMGDGDDEPTNQEVLDAVRQLEQKFIMLSEDFNELRYELNELEEKVDRRT